MSPKEKEIIDGLILSDAHIENRCKNARMGLVVKHRGFAEAVKCSVPSLPWGNIKKSSYYDSRTNKTYSRVHLRSRTDKYLTKQHARWYLGGKKFVPKDLVLTKSVLLWWYIGDGHLERRKTRPKYRRVCLSTDSFTGCDLQYLIKSLKTLLGDQNIYPEYNRIMISRNALCVFSRMLYDDCELIPEYKYKFEFGQYLNPNYLADSYLTRPLVKINAYRKKNRIRKLNFEIMKTKET